MTEISRGSLTDIVNRLRKAHYDELYLNSMKDYFDVLPKCVYESIEDESYIDYIYEDIHNKDESIYDAYLNVYTENYGKLYYFSDIKLDEKSDLKCVSVGGEKQPIYMISSCKNLNKIDPSALNNYITKIFNDTPKNIYVYRITLQKDTYTKLYSTDNSDLVYTYNTIKNDKIHLVRTLNF